MSLLSLNPWPRWQRWSSWLVLWTSQAALATPVAGVQGLEILPTLTTAGSPADPLYAPPSNGFLNGVVRLDNHNGRGEVFGMCSGALVAPEWVLTAAHCLLDRFLFPRGMSVVFPDGRRVDVASYLTFPGFDADSTNHYLRGHDLGLMRLAAPVTDVAPYELYTGLGFGEVGTLAGYGLGGSGTDPETLPFGTLRTGENEFEMSISQSPLGLVAPGDADSTLFVYDLDDGRPACNRLAQDGQQSSLGLGAREAGLSGGDSGGPSFIGGRLAGVHSFSIRWLFDPDSPYRACWNQLGGFGDGSADVRVAQADNLRWIQTTLGVPEPGSLALALLATLVAGLPALRRQPGKASTRPGWRRLWVGLALAAAGAAATATPATLVQAFGSSQWASFDLTEPLALRHAHPGRADRVTADGDQVWWQQGQDIYTARSDGSNARLYLHTSVAAHDLAVDAEAGRFYVSLPGIGVRALDIDRPDQVMGFLSGDYLRVTAGGGHVFAATAQGRIAVSDASFDRLDGLIETVGDSLTDLAYDESIDALYGIYQATYPDASLVSAVAQFRRSNRAASGYQVVLQAPSATDSFTSVAAAAGTVIWNSSVGLWMARSDWWSSPQDRLPTIRQVNNFGLRPLDLALVAAVAPTPLPEPGTAWLALGAALAVLVRQSRGRAMAR